jgi:hypothetical protein
MEQELYPNRWRWALIGLFYLILLPTLARAGGSSLALAGMAVFAVYGGIMLLPGSTSLKLDVEGFTSRMAFRDQRYEWNQIAAFKVITTRYMGFIPVRRRVGFDFAESYKKKGLARKFLHAFVPYDRLLPDNYGMKAKDLAVLLETWRVRQQAALPMRPAPYGE